MNKYFLMTLLLSASLVLVHNVNAGLYDIPRPSSTGLLNQQVAYPSFTTRFASHVRYLSNPYAYTNKELGAMVLGATAVAYGVSGSPIPQIVADTSEQLITSYIPQLYNKDRIRTAAKVATYTGSALVGATAGYLAAKRLLGW